VGGGASAPPPPRGGGGGGPGEGGGGGGGVADGQTDQAGGRPNPKLVVADGSVGSSTCPRRI